MQSVFDIFKIGIGPSSSHTMGPMRAALRFVREFGPAAADVQHVVVELHGSLALTGKGHMTDHAVMMGLAGMEPETVDLDGLDAFIASVNRDGKIPFGDGGQLVDFAPERDIEFIAQQLPLHENGLMFRAYSANGTEMASRTFYSIGGGFVVDAEHFDAPDGTLGDAPYPFSSGADILRLCADHGLSFSTLIMRNEEALHPGVDITEHFEKIWGVMDACIERGLKTEGVLPGGLHVTRRAAPLLRMLRSDDPLTVDPIKVIDWVNLFALAVSEENAAGGRMVTAPTSGACGVVPAVMKCYGKFIRELSPDDRTRYLLTCGAIGLLFKMNASISGAEVGCQGEVGVACSMAAAGLTEISGGSPLQVTTAAEIAMEHCLGMTCDPIAGLVQVPCIERNAIAAVKAVNASRMALRRTTPPRISLDEVIETMYQTGKDMNAKYRETSEGGLATAVRCGS